MGNITLLKKLYNADMSDIDTVIAKVVEDIWGTYDKDNSGALDKEETKQFVMTPSRRWPTVTTTTSSTKRTSTSASRSSTRMAPAPSRSTRWPSSSRRSPVSEQLAQELDLTPSRV